MQVKEFRFLSWQEKFIDSQFKNWSRCYEWGYVLSELKKLENLKLNIHNTCCGPSEIHKQFHDVLISNPNHIVFNSDIIQTETNKNFTNFFNYDIIYKNDNKYDIVLCISTLEELKDNKKNLVDSFHNLLNQTKEGGRLIITCDFPMIQPEVLELLVNEKCQDTLNRLTGITSQFKQPEFKNLSIILLDLQK
jgi:peroxiredoxin family protein